MINRHVLIFESSKKAKIGALFFFIVVSAVFFSPYFQFHYSNDDYPHEVFPGEIAAQASSQGRPLLSLLALVAKTLNVNLVTHQVLIWPAVIIVYGAALFFLYEILSARSLVKKQVQWPVLLLTPAILTTWGMAELQIYASINLPNAFAFFFCILGAYFLIFFDSALFLIFAFLSVLSSLFFYQGYITFWFPVILLGLYINRGHDDKFIKKFSFALIFYFSGYLFDWLWIKFAHNHIAMFGHWTDQRTGAPDLINNLGKVAHGLKIVILQGYKILFPKFIFLIFILLGIFTPIAFSRSRSSKLKYIILNISFVLVLIFFASLPHIFTGVVIFFVRSVLAIAAIPAFLNILNLVHYKDSPRSGILVFILVCSISYQLLSFYNMEVFGSDIVSVNKMDLLVAGEFYSEIQKYEKQSGKEIKNVYFVNDSDPSHCYKDLNRSKLLSRAFTVPWSAVFSLNKVSGRNWAYIPCNNKYKNEFGGDNWNTINVPEQIHFKGNDAIIAVF